MIRETIWQALARRLGREPTHREACAEVRRILDEAATERMVRYATAGKLQHQRKG